MPQKWKIVLFSVIGIAFLMGCADNNISSNPDYKLTFSQDTVAFDTVFSTIGSATNSFVIYNRNAKPLRISSIALANGNTSGFHLVVDGVVPTGNTLSDIEIRARDSLYVFVNVTVNPTLQNNPVLVQDSIIFTTNGNRQRVQLIAYGQDVVIFRAKTIHNDTVLSARKPYLIYDYLAVDPGKSLTIEPGSTLYFHNKASLKIAGKLIAEGTRQAPIVFRGDRLDKLFENVPYAHLSGQWGGIQLPGQQSSAALNYVCMMSGKTALRIPDGTPANMPLVNINNTRIQNFDSCGISAYNANITISNSEISNCRVHCIDFTGGVYNLTHNTVANYYNDIFSGKRRSGAPSVMLSNGENNAHLPGQSPSPLTVQFVNCVIAGSLPTELAITDTTRTTPLRFLFDHCYITSAPGRSSSFKNVQWGNPKEAASLFISTVANKSEYYDFRPGEQSPLRGKADLSISRQPLFSVDMNGISRLLDNAPDIGAYQWKKE